MTHTDAPAFFQRLAALSEVFDAKFSEAKAELYFTALMDLPLTVVVQALNTAVKTCTFMPRPAEIRTLALGDAEDGIEAAWMAFRKALGAVGAYASLATADAALGEAIVALWGSWPAACAADLSPEMWAAKRKEFGRVYRVIRERHLAGVRYLPGLCEMHNAGRLAWTKYVPVAVLEGSSIRALAGAEAESYRQLISAQAHALTHITADGLMQSLPDLAKGETA